MNVNNVWFSKDRHDSIIYIALGRVVLKPMLQSADLAIWPQGHITFYMLNSTVHEISTANKHYNAEN